MKKKERGNTLALVIVLIAIVGILLAFFVLNYHQLMGGQKQTQSAIDAAALAAAVDISRVVVDTPLGRVALVDDVPAVASSPPTGSNFSSPLKSDAHPIQGINTIMGTIRLDAVIANKLGNKSIAFLIGQDIARAQEAAATLTASINSACQGQGAVYDKFGNPINIFVANDTAGKGDAQQAYNANSLSLANGNGHGIISVELGYVSANVSTTNISLPSSEQSGGATTYYSPYTPYQVPPLFSKGATITPQFTGNTNMPATVAGNFQFAAIAMAPTAALIDKSSWYGPSSAGAPLGSYAPATAVHVYVSQAVTPLANGGKSASLSTEAYAQAGGGAAALSYSGHDSNIFATLFGMAPAYAQSSSTGGLLTPSGTLEISFASGGIPGLSDTGLQGQSQYAAPNNQKLQMSNTQGASTINSTSGLFNNVMTIMNASTADPATGNVTSDSPWAPTTGAGGTTANGTMVSPGNWFITEGGAVPGSGTLSQPSSLVPASDFKTLNTTGNDNPSVALSYIVYDWLKTLGVRPNVQSLYNALTLTDASLPANSTFYSFESLLTGSNAMPVPVNYKMVGSEIKQSGLAANFAASDDNSVSDSWLPPAYAHMGHDRPGIISAVEQFGFGNGANDPRNLGKASREDAQRQQQNVWGYVPADATISSNSMLAKMADGDPETVDGNPLSDAYQLWGALSVSATVAEATKNNAGRIINSVLAALEKQDQQFQNLSQQKIALQNQLQSSPNASLKSQLTAVDNQLNNISAGYMPQAFKQAPRAYAALVNAQYFMHVTRSIYSNFKVLTGIGCKQISKTHYILAGSDFWPTYQLATASALKGTGAVPTGQDTSLPVSDWTTPPSAQNKSQLNFYKHIAPPVVGRLGGQGNSWLQPAFATVPSPSAQNPYDNLHFCFFVIGSGAGQGQVHLYVGPDPFINSGGSAIGTLEGQALYQDVQALQTNPTITTVPPTAAQIISAVLNATSGVISVPTSTTSTYTVWQVQARDQTANNYVSDTANDTAKNQAAAYFADTGNNGSVSSESNQGWCGLNQQGSSGNWQTPQCPALAAEWQLTCPMPASYNYITQTQYTLPPITYQEITATCEGNEGAGASFTVLGNLASFSVGGVNINVFAANQHPSDYDDSFTNFQGQAAYNTNSGIHMVDFNNYGLYAEISNQGNVSAYMQALINSGRFNGEQSYIATFHS